MIYTRVTCTRDYPISQEKSRDHERPDYVRQRTYFHGRLRTRVYLLSQEKSRDHERPDYVRQRTCFNGRLKTRFYGITYFHGGLSFSAMSAKGYANSSPRKTLRWLRICARAHFDPEFAAAYKKTTGETPACLVGDYEYAFS